MKMKMKWRDRKMVKRFIVTVISNNTEVLEFRTLNRAIVAYKKIVKAPAHADSLVTLGFENQDDIFQELVSNVGDNGEDVIHHGVTRQLQRILEEKILMVKPLTENSYSFYAYSKTDSKEFRLLGDAIKHFNKLRENNSPADYISLGVIKNGMFACDIVSNTGIGNTLKISSDYTQLDSFKNDKLVCVNMVCRLKREFLLG